MTNDPIEAALHRLRRFHNDEDGMIIWGLIMTIMFFLVLSGFVYNSGKTVAAKIETQNAADAIAYSSSVWVARGMNTVTATNHLMGELNALYVLHHALGGKHLDENSGTNRTITMIRKNEVELRLAYRGTQLLSRVAPAPGPLGFVYNAVKKYTRADKNSTIYQAKMNLKNALLIAYGVHSGGALGIASKFPPAVIAGGIAIGLSLAAQLKIWQEYKFLDIVEAMAAATKGVKKTIPSIISGLHRYQKSIRVGTPVVTAAAAKRIKDAHGLESGFVMGATVPPLVKLPVEYELAKLRTEKRSQMIRATYPWVWHWRKNIRRIFSIAATLSRASSLYRKYTDQYSLEASTWLRKSGNYRADLTVVNRGRFSFGGGEDGQEIRLPVVKGLKDVPGGVDKGREKWNDWNNVRTSSLEIENIFSHMAFAKRKSPKVAADSIFRQENHNGVVAFAHAMVYNANEKRALKRSQQPKVTWDTLNWNGPVVEFDKKGGSPQTPKIKLNWQAKLTPVTKHKLTKTGIAAGIIDAEMREVLLGSREALLVLTNH